VGSGRDADALEAVARRSPSPGLVVVRGEPDASGLPLLADRPLLAGRAAAYVCRGMVCELPTSDPGELAAQLGSGAAAGAVS
jgi:uncharacterized protein